MSVSGIIAFFTALPEIIILISRLGNIFDSLLKYSQQNNLNGWIDELEKTVDDLSNAKSAQEKTNAAQKLVGIVRGIGPR